jgi:hypothetical protein
MAKWDGFSEEDIKKVRACERLVDGNVRSFRKSIYRISNLTENEICTTFWGIRLWRLILGHSTGMHAQSGSDVPLQWVQHSFIVLLYGMVEGKGSSQLTYQSE